MDGEKLMLNSYLSFKLGDETFAANVSKVLNILEMTKITKVPKAPPYMKGVINLRGTVLPVVDTRVKFGMSDTEFTPNTCILVLEVEVEGEALQVGGLVDSVQEVLEFEPHQILPPPNIGSRYRSEFINGMYKLNDEHFIMLLDMDKVFSSDEALILRDSTSESGSEEHF
ncbi:chemotaxis protein CheW [uncultured Acetobacteroides sp.]|uniref:chemotaxis protein CheW n=1 Tax=uncultured Acetobacteroides sp. TaxID=1760811 RepID=UPI0029F59288|nr:chemotaxis protein CheW [uncultured Acetobacteroides sp.]